MQKLRQWRQVKDGKVIAGGRIKNLPEAVIKIENGLKSSRRPDILVRRKDGSLYGINVGKTRVDGSMVKREAEAIADLKSSDIEMLFVQYGR